jgi:predicted dehydrogenase
MNLAFFGTGELARPYLNALARRDDVRIVAVCDPDPRAAEAVAAGWGARVFPHYEPMLEESAPAALWVCVPPRLQGGVLERAVALGVPFFVEPPGAPDDATARRLARRIAEANLVAAVGYSARYVDVIREAKEYLGINAVPLTLGWWLTGPAEPDQPAAGLLWGEACRLIDMVRYFSGEVAAVCAAAPSAEALTCTLRLANGTTATLACAAYELAEPRVELELLGEGWYFRFLEALTVLRLAEKDKTTIIRQMNAPHAEHAAAFLEAVRSGDPSAVACPYADACVTMHVCQAILDASREGRWVDLPS